jgi:hypothetical protein
MESFQESYLEGLIPISHYFILDEGDNYYEVSARLARASKNASPMKATFQEGHYYYNPKSNQIIDGWRNEVSEKLVLNIQFSLYVNETYVRMEDENGVMRLIDFNRVRHL